jgi:hypothetical protein
VRVHGVDAERAGGAVELRAGPVVEPRREVAVLNHLAAGRLQQAGHRTERLAEVSLAAPCVVVLRFPPEVAVAGGGAGIETVETVAQKRRHEREAFQSFELGGSRRLPQRAVVIAVQDLHGVRRGSKRRHEISGRTGHHLLVPVVSVRAVVIDVGVAGREVLAHRAVEVLVVVGSVVRQQRQRPLASHLQDIEAGAQIAGQVA